MRAADFSELFVLFLTFMRLAKFKFDSVISLSHGDNDNISVENKAIGYSKFQSPLGF